MNGNDSQNDFQSWVSAWQSGEQADALRLPAIDAEAIRRRSRRYLVGMIWLSTGELLTSIALLIWMAMRAMEAQTLTAWVGFGLALALVAIAEWLVLTNRRGTYQPTNQTLRAYLDLEILRAERQLRTARAIVPFVVVETVLVVAWGFWEVSAQPQFAERGRAYLTDGVALGLVFIGLTLLASVLWRRRMAKQLVERRAFRQALDEAEEGT